MSEGPRLEANPDALRLMIEGLGGARIVVEFYSRRRARDAVEHLMTCHAHHFAVIGEGHHLACSHLAVECLHRASLLPAAETRVYENVRE